MYQTCILLWNQDIKESIENVENLGLFSAIFGECKDSDGDNIGGEGEGMGGDGDEEDATDAGVSKSDTNF